MASHHLITSELSSNASKLYTHSDFNKGENLK